MIRVGFEVETGEPVEVPLHHMCVTGLTRLAGKTTAVMGMLDRLTPMKSLVFLTKRGEVEIDGHRHVPFYREQSDWEYVESLLAAAMKTNQLKLERSFIINASRGTSSLREVYENIKKGREGAKRGFDESVWTNLEAYFEKVLPELEKSPFDTELILYPGLNIMNLGHLSEEVQSLVIASCLEEVWKNSKDVVIVVPEAWKFMPQARGNPVKWAAQHVIREGGAVGIYLIIDSQDITGVDKAILKSVDNWLLGRQREKNEVQRVLDQIPFSTKPKAEEIQQLRLGQFFVAAGDTCRKVYAQPAWMNGAEAQDFAKDPDKMPPPLRPGSEDFQDPLTDALNEAEISKAQLEAMQDRLRDLETKLEEADVRAETWEAEALQAGERLEVYDQLGIALARTVERHIVFPEAAGQDFITNAQTLDSLASRVAARLNQQIPRAEQPPLLEKYQREAEDRLFWNVSQLETKEKRILEWLLAVDKRCRLNEVARGLAIPETGSRYSEFSAALNKVLKVKGFVDVDSHGVKASLRERVEAELKPYTEKAEEIERVYQHLLVAIGQAALGETRVV